MNVFKVYNWVTNTLKKQFHQSCFLCEKRLPELKQGLCSACREDFPLNQNVCSRCGVIIYNSDNDYPHFRICGQCMITPPHWHSLTALCQYDYPASNIIQSLKYNAQFANAKLLSSMFISKIKNLPNTLIPECIMPVPLHCIRQKQRGFNQAIELSRPIAKAFNISFDTSLCKRVVDTESQAGLDKNLRLSNMIGAFELTQTPPYKHIVIFDDVVTTGHTVSSLCKLLVQGGVERVDIWCIARASKQ